MPERPNVVVHPGAEQEASAALSDWAELVPADPYTLPSEVDALVIDASAIEPAELAALPWLEQALERGTPVALLHLDDPRAGAINERLGSDATAPGLVGLLQRSAGDSGDEELVSQAEDDASVDEDGEVIPAASAAVAELLGDALRSALDPQPPTAAPSPASGPPAGLIPPAGATFGIFTYPNGTSRSYTVNRAIWGFSGSQRPSYSTTNDLYVYREDGHGLDNYVAVLVQRGIASPGTVLRNSSNVRGYAQGLLTIDNEVTRPDGSGFGSGLSWLASHPKTVNLERQVTTGIDDTFSWEVSMKVDASGAGSEGKVSESVTVSNSVTTNIKDWGVVERSDPRTKTTAWTFFQRAPFNYLTRYNRSFGGWYRDAFSGFNGPVRGFPELSRFTLQYHTVSAWRFAGRLIENGRLRVRFRTRVRHRLLMIKNRRIGDNHHKLHQPHYSARVPRTIDLVAVARPT